MGFRTHFNFFVAWSISVGWWAKAVFFNGSLEELYISLVAMAFIAAVWEASNSIIEQTKK